MHPQEIHAKRLQLRERLQRAKPQFAVTAGNLCTGRQCVILPEEELEDTIDCPWLACNDPRCIETTKQLWTLYMIDQKVDGLRPGASPIIPEELWSKHCTAHMVSEVIDNLSQDGA